MASNSFGTIFKITTWGESHGKAIGVVIDGCPSGLEITDSDINEELSIRKPGKSPYTSPRAEIDNAEILSGVFEGKTTGAPISIIIYNKDADSSKYEPIKDLLRPGHANFTYLEKYGIFDYRGGGRSSARETACRVAAGAVAKKLLSFYNIKLASYIKEIGGITSPETDFSDINNLKVQIQKNPIFCPDIPSSEKMMQKIVDALGGDIAGKKIALLGLAFKANTDDIRYSPAITIAAKLAQKFTSTKIRVTDPEAITNSRKELSEFSNIEFFDDHYAAIKDADLIVIATEWKNYSELDFDKVKQLTNSRIIVDLRNILDAEKTRAAGFKYIYIGGKN